MLSKSIYMDKLEELINAKKADESVLATIKENETQYQKASANLEELLREIKEIEVILEKQITKRKETPVYKIKEFSQAFKEANITKKEHEQKLSKKIYYEQLCKDTLKQNYDIEEDVEKQYIIYQENEIYIKAVNKITEKCIDLSAELYTLYLNHINEYLNSKYSIKENTKLIEPDPKDLATLLSILQKNEEKEKKSSGKTRRNTRKKESAEAENKKVTRKKNTKIKDSKEEDSAEKKKNTKKRTTKTESQKQNPVEDKKNTRRKTTKTETIKEDSEQEKKTTRKKTINTQNKDKKTVEENKTTRRKNSKQ